MNYMQMSMEFALVKDASAIRVWIKHMKMRLKKVMEVNRMNYWFTAVLIVLICLLTLIEPAYPGSTQTNTSGSNTAIEGGYTSTA